VRQIPLSIVPEPPATFDSFITGANAAAITHLRSLALAAAAPVYLWGPSGSGKSHLLLALASAVRGRGAQAGWFDATVAAPWHFDESWALVVIDCCDELDAAQQRAAFALFVSAQGQGAQVAAAGTVPPVDLPLREDLRTRLGSGPVFTLQPLGESDARTVLRREADRRGIALGDDVLDYLLTRFSRDLKHLMALLARLDEFALSEQRGVTVPLLRKMFDDAGAVL
jgi:DnaA-homolog protein